MNNAFELWQSQQSNAFKLAFQQTIDKALPGGENQLHDAIRYVTQSSGKLIRPLLCFATCDALAESYVDAMPMAMALEAIHIYSLTHDDLPAMDNDDLRRGLPTCHIKFDEATAILAGDALQSLAFEILSESHLNDSAKVRAIQYLAKAAGAKGMAGGQMLDIMASEYSVSSLQLADLDRLHRLKTGALIDTAVLGTAALFNTSSYHRKKLAKFASCIGLAFQIQDDILDVTGETSLLGKPAGSDVSLNKLTYPALLGLAGSQSRMHNLYEQAIESLENFPGNVGHFKALASLIVDRDH